MSETNENLCKAEEWQRDGRGLWAMRSCLSWGTHSAHTFSPWQYNVQPPTRETPGAVAPDLRALIAALRERTWLAPVSAEEMNRRDRWLADQLAAVGDRERRAALEDAAKIADAMALNPWGVPHDAITPGHVAEMIARAIRDKADELAALLRSEPADGA